MRVGCMKWWKKGHYGEKNKIELSIDNEGHAITLTFEGQELTIQSPVSCPKSYRNDNVSYALSQVPFLETYLTRKLMDLWDVADDIARDLWYTNPPLTRGGGRK